MIMGRPMLGILIFIGAIPFLFFIQGQLYVIDLEPLIISEIKVPISAIFLSIMTVAFILGSFQGSLNEADKDQKRFFKICIVFVSMPAFSILLSIDPFHSFIYYLLDLLLPFLFFVILIKSINNMEDIVNLILVLIVAIFVYQVFCLYFISKTSVIGLSAATVNVRDFGASQGFMALLIPLLLPLQIALHKVLIGRKKWISTFIILVFAIYLFLSNNRTAISGLLVGIVIFYLGYYRIPKINKFIWGFLLVVVLASIFLFYTELLREIKLLRFMHIFQRLVEDETLNQISSNRLNIWKSALNMIYDHFLFGVGPGMWDQYIPQYSLTMYFYRNLYTNELIRYYSIDPHNLYLLIYTNYGVINVVCYLSILYVATKKACQNIKRSSTELTRTISIGALISLVVWMWMSLFGLRFITFNYALIFWVVVAIIIKVAEIQSDTGGHRQHNTSPL